MHRRLSWGAVALLMFTTQGALSDDTRAEEIAKTTNMDNLREWFNRSSDSVRIVSLLSPT